MIENTIPIINVADLPTSLDFYKNTLDFSTDWEAQVDSDKVAGISRDGCSIYLCEGLQGVRGSWLWIGAESADYFDQVIASGATIVQEATNYPWAYELRVQDPDGNVIRIGTEPMHPNADTLEAMLELDEDEGTVFKSTDDLFADW